MWRKFLRLDGITVDTRFTVQSLCLHNSSRRHMTLEQRREETEYWMTVIADRGSREAMVNRYWSGFVQAHFRLQKRLNTFRHELATLRSKVAELEAAERA